MSTKVRYEFDVERQVLIKCPSEGMPKIIEKNNLIWRDLGPQDEPYDRAIFLGQGCWERPYRKSHDRRCRKKRKTPSRLCYNRAHLRKYRYLSTPLFAD